MREVSSNIPIGVMDTDSELTLVDSKDFTDSLNTFQRPNAKKRSRIPGNVQLPDALPALVNRSVGFLEDKYRQTGIDFISNTGGNHRIRRFWSLEDRFETLLEWSGLNFSNRVNESASVDGRHLFWTDWNGESGNQPRYLDMDLASLYQKRLCYELYWDAASFGASNDYSIGIEDLDGNPVLAPTVFYTSGGGPVGAEASALHAALAGGGYGITTEFCGNKIKVCANTAERRIRITSTGNDIHFPGTNHYPETMREEYISLIHIRPHHAPFPKYVNDPALTENKVFGFTFQFRYRYVFWNRSRSKWSPISYVPTNFIQGTETLNDDRYNKIEIDFIDDVFVDEGWKHLVRGVEVAVRYELSGIWRFVGNFDIADFGVSSSQGFGFLNDGSYPAVASDENSEGGVQALGNFDFVPRFTSAMEVIQDEQGRHRLALFGNLEQYDQPDCAVASISHQSAFPAAAPSTPTDQSVSRKHFKRGGQYDVFIRYEDTYGRQWPDLFLGRYSKPWDTDGFPRVQIDHLPPEGAVRFWLCFSENQNQGAYFQNPAFNVTYWKKEPHPSGGEGTYTSTTYGAGDADLVGFEFIINSDPPINYSFLDDDKALLAQGGDRIHIMGTASEDYVVEGYNLTTPSGTGALDRYSVFIKFDASQPDYTLPAPSDYHLVELYRPSNGDSGLAYEVGSVRAISNPGTPSRSHGGPFDIDDRGDAYRYSRQFKNIFFGSPPTVLVTGIERPELHLFKAEVGPDFGRASTSDPDYSERYAYDQLRVSDVFVPDTGINGFQSFRGLEYIRTRRDYGRARSLQFVGGVLLAICEYACQPVYIGKDRLLDLSGNTSVGRTSQLLNVAGELDRMLGTQNPESIVNTGKYVYGFDSFKGAPWRYSVGGGIDEIWGNNVGLFRELGKENEPFILGGFDPRFDIYYLAFAGRTFITYGYKEASPEDPRQGWEGRFSFVQENFGSVGLRFFSFQLGQYWEHGSGSQLYGSNFEANINLAVNAAPRSLKNFWNLQVRGDLWHVPLLQCHPISMQSMVLPGKFSNFEGQWRVDLPRDGHDPILNPNKLPDPNMAYVTALLRGRVLKGEVMEIRLRAVDGADELKEVNVEYDFSMETK